MSHSTRPALQAAGQKGFSLIELLIVVAIIGIITAIAIPNLLSSRKASNEGVAISSLRTISTAQQTYRQSYGNNNAFAPGLGDLHTNGLIIDAVLSSGNKSGYDMTMSLSADLRSFSVNADPETPGLSGDRHFFTNDTGVIRFKKGAAAAVGDPPIQ